MLRPLSRARLMSFSLASFVPTGHSGGAAVASSSHVADSSLHGPFPRTAVRVELSNRFNRATTPAVETAIAQLWADHTQRAPRLFNGTKFRLHDWRVEPTGLALQCGMTDYKSYLGTCVSERVGTLRERGQQERGQPTAFLSRKIGVSGVVETSDTRVALIERSGSVGVYQQLVDTPGGHPEPSDLPFTIEELETLEEGSEHKTAVEASVVERLFGSIVDEVHEEINVAPAQLSEPVLLGVVFQSEAETPSFVFHMTTALSSAEVDALYKLGPQDKFESTRLCWVDKTSLDKFQLTPAAQGSLSLWQQYCTFRSG